MPLLTKHLLVTQVVNDTNPTFFYCATPGHCAKGMFGIMSVASVDPSSVSLKLNKFTQQPLKCIPNPIHSIPNAPIHGCEREYLSDSCLHIMPFLKCGAQNSDVKAYVSYTETQSGKTAAGKWGNNIDLGGLPDWSHQYVAENVMYTRNFLAVNPEVLADDGFVDLSAAGTTPLMIPQDLSVAISNAGSSSAASPVAASPATVTPSAPSASSVSSSLNNGAMFTSSPKAVVGLVAAVATFLMM